jgi:protein disulfide-isomerase
MLKAKYFLSLVACVALASACAADLPWLTDLPKAKELAKSQKKMVLMDFTGSDWCPWCIRLDKEVFQTPEFAGYAKTNLVLVMIDFPKRKQLPEALAKANRTLAKEFNVEAFPTLIVLNSEGKKAGEPEYAGGGPKALIEAINACKGK